MCRSRPKGHDATASHVGLDGAADVELLEAARVEERNCSYGGFRLSPATSNHPRGSPGLILFRGGNTLGFVKGTCHPRSRALGFVRKRG